MAGELANLGHGGVLPQAQLVLAEPVGAEDLTLVGVPLQGAHLHKCMTERVHTSSTSRHAARLRVQQAGPP